MKTLQCFELYYIKLIAIKIISVKANPSTVKTNNLPNVSNTTPQNFVKKYRPSLNKFSNNNNN